jgi:hypothetical protein
VRRQILGGGDKKGQNDAKARDLTRELQTFSNDKFNIEVGFGHESG